MVQEKYNAAKEEVQRGAAVNLPADVDFYTSRTMRWIMISPGKLCYSGSQTSSQKMSSGESERSTAVHSLDL